MFKAKLKNERAKWKNKLKQAAQFATFDHRYYDSPHSEYSEPSYNIVIFCFYCGTFSEF